MRITALCCLLALPFVSWSQNTISGVINDYAVVTAITACPGTVTVDSAVSAFAPGDVALIIQMQGATIDETQTASFGNVTNIGNAGRFERCIISAINGNDITFQNLLQNTYDVAGKVQLVRMPQYTVVDVVAPVTAYPWDGSRGGVIAFEATGTLTLFADIDATGAGFRGGDNIDGTGGGTCQFTDNITEYWMNPGGTQPRLPRHGALKGEGIAIISTAAGKDRGRGKQANGGGGGNDHNSGGGGGGNGGVGGLGGENDDPGFFTCHGYNPGKGGAALTGYTARMFLGGGGGSGHGNNNTSGAGGNGGGIIYVSAPIIDGNNFGLIAGGAIGGNSVGDGAGGGGGGGTIFSDCPLYASSVNFHAIGGEGGSADGFNQARCFGPGGGGGGGRVSHNGTGSFSMSVSPGIPGIIFNSTSGCNLSNVSAIAGNAGIVNGLFNMPTSNMVASLSITTNPASQSACPGSTVLFNAQANGTGTTYQWQQLVTGVWMNLQDTGVISNSGTQQLTVSNITPGMDGTQYRAFIGDLCLPDTATTAATLTVGQAPVPTAQPVDVTLCNGSATSFVFATTAGATGYQWEVNTGSGWQTLLDTGIVSNSTTDSLIISSISAAMDGWQYRCLVTSNCPGSLISNAANLQLISAPSTTVQPQGGTFCAAAATTLNFGLSDSTGMAFQWQINDGSGWANLLDTGNVTNSGTPSVTLNPVGMVSGSLQYRCVASSGCFANVVSATAAIASHTALAMTNPANQSGCPGTTVLFDAQATGAGPTYQWQQNIGGNWMNLQDTGTVSNSTTQQLTLSNVTAGMDGNQYRVLVSDSCTVDSATSSATLTVTPAPTATVQPTDVTVCNGSAAAFTFSTTAGATGYQWQVNTGSGWQNLLDTGIVSNSTTANLAISSVSSGMDAWQYRCLVTSACPGTVTSNPATLNLIVAPVANSQPQGGTQCITDSLGLDFGLSNPAGMTFQWQINDGTGWSNLLDTGNISNSTTSSLTINPVGVVQGSPQFRCVASSGCFADIISSPATITSFAAPTFAMQPASTNGCVGVANTFSVQSSDPQVTYQWQLNNGSGWQNLQDTGAVDSSQTPNLQIVVTNGMTGWEFRCIISSLCSGSTVSQSAALGTIGDPPSILSQPADQIACEGATTSLFFAVSDLSLAFQWQIDTGNGFESLNNGPHFAGTTFNSLAIINASSGFNQALFYCEIAACGSSMLTDTVMLLVVPEANASFSYQVFGDSVAFFNSSAGATTFSWNFGDSTGTSSSLHTGHTYTQNGTYIVSLTATSGSCGSNDTLVAIQITGVGIDEQAAPEINVWPIPANTDLIVNLGSTTNDWKLLTITDALGREVARTQLAGTKSQLTVPVSDWSDGVYFIRLAGNGKSFSHTVLIAH